MNDNTWLMIGFGIILAIIILGNVIVPAQINIIKETNCCYVPFEKDCKEITYNSSTDICQKHGIYNYSYIGKNVTVSG